jgi:hypothetical protein
LRRRFTDENFEPGQLPNSRQARLLLRVLDVYERKALLNERGAVAALCQICPHSEACWPPAPNDERREPTQRYGDDDEDGGLCLPWIGPEYDTGGVVVLGINLNFRPRDYTELLSEHAITWKSATQFAVGAKAEGGSRFGFAAMRSAAALLDWLEGKPVCARRPKELVEPLRRIARVQAVKCVPCRRDSKPFPEMWKNCPPLVLGDELHALRPRVVLALGERPAHAITQLRGFGKSRDDAPRICQGAIRRGRWQADVFTLPHPRSGNVSSELSFIRALRADQRNLTT